MVAKTPLGLQMKEATQNGGLVDDQIILEYRGGTQNWVHTSYNAERQRKMAFTMVNDKTYGQGFVLL
jgi:hypothetical protein